MIQIGIGRFADKVNANGNFLYREIAKDGTTVLRTVIFKDCTSKEEAKKLLVNEKATAAPWVNNEGGQMLTISIPAPLEMGFEIDLMTEEEAMVAALAELEAMAAPPKKLGKK